MKVRVSTNPKAALVAPPYPKCSPSSLWAMWIGRFIAALCIGLSGGVGASTDFDRMEQLATIEYGKAAADRIKAWRTMIENSRTQPDRAKLERANAFVNNHALYESDIVIWQQEDYWATPLELFGKHAGDCEDFAIAKYITLRLMDIPVQKLRLVYVRARLGGSKPQAHMVLSYFETPTADPLVLDNLIDVIHPGKRRPDLFPVFSFNHEGLWMEGERNSSGDPTARLSRWRGVLQRMQREGLDPALVSLNTRSLLSWKKPKFRPSLKKLAKSRSSQKKAASFNATSKKSALSRSTPKKTAGFRSTSKKMAKSMPVLRKGAKR